MALKLTDVPQAAEFAERYQKMMRDKEHMERANSFAIVPCVDGASLAISMFIDGEFAVELRPLLLGHLNERISTAAAELQQFYGVEV